MSTVKNKKRKRKKKAERANKQHSLCVGVWSANNFLGGGFVSVGVLKSGTTADVGGMCYHHPNLHLLNSSGIYLLKKTKRTSTRTTPMPHMIRIIFMFFHQNLDLRAPACFSNISAPSFSASARSSS